MSIKRQRSDGVSAINVILGWYCMPITVANWYGVLSDNVFGIAFRQSVAIGLCFMYVIGRFVFLKGRLLPVKGRLVNVRRRFVNEI